MRDVLRSSCALLLPAALMIFYSVVGAFVVGLGVGTVLATFVLDLALVGCVVGALRIGGVSVRGDRSRLSGVGIVVFVVGLLVVWYVGQAVGLAVRDIAADSGYDSYYQGFASMDMLALVFVSVVCAPVYEELAYRRLSIGTMRRFGWGPAFTCAWCALAFAMSHGTVTHLVPTFVLGVFLGCVFELTRDVAWCVIGHVLYNVLSIFAAEAIPSGVSGGSLHALAGINVIAVVVCLLVASHKVDVSRLLVDDAEAIDRDC